MPAESQQPHPVVVGRPTGWWWDVDQMGASSVVHPDMHGVNRSVGAVSAVDLDQLETEPHEQCDHLSVIQSVRCHAPTVAPTGATRAQIGVVHRHRRCR